MILEALAQQLAEGGLQDFSIADAAQRVGVATRTIYRYFPNREALLDAVGAWVDHALCSLTEDSASAAAHAVISHLVTAETWKHLRDEFGISGEASGQAVAWAIRTLIANLQQRQSNH